MNDLTKEEILDIVRESNKEKLKEYYPHAADEVTAAREVNLNKYKTFGNTVNNALIQMVQKVKADYEEGVISDADVDFIISDQCGRIQDAINYTIASLETLKETGIKDTLKGPLPVRENDGE